ncbi:hypothetical protein HY468_05065, partial [Candidatus Roizmanbacteria bacterium]|nr:hypothetical protein [Candidatus Roizmanbacteria bacterium]
FPFFFLPITRDYFDFNKHILLTVAALLSIAVFAIISIKQRRFVFYTHPLDRALLGVAGTFLLSLLISSPNKVEALLFPTGVLTILSLISIVFFGRQLLLYGKHQKEKQSIAGMPLLYSAAVLSMLFFMSRFGLLAKLSSLPAYMKTETFTPAGSVFMLVTFLTIVVLYSVFFLRSSGTKKNTVSPVSVLLLVLSVSAVLVGLSTLMKPQYRPQLLPHSAGWTITVESLKNGKTALFGVGPGNFLNAFTQGKPPAMNSGDLWAFRFINSSNFYFDIFTTLGLVGLAAIGYLLFSIWKLRDKHLGLLAVLIAIVVIPANILLLFLLFLFLLETTANHVSMLHYPAKSSSDPLAEAFDEDTGKNRPTGNRSVIFFSLMILVGIASTGYFLARAYSAEAYITRGINSAATANNRETYDLQLKALELNPFMSAYHIVFARTNIALANLVAGKENLTDNDKQTINQLVTQAVNNAKAAVQLSPSVITWENLASIYANLLTAAKGADQWTVAAYDRAISFDPLNPALRLALGGVYYSLKLYEPAARQFEIAVSMKDNYANGWYNLANTYRQLEKIEQARAAYQKTLTILEPDSNDYKKAQEELTALPEKPVTPSVTNLEELTQPESTPSGRLQRRPIEDLGQDAGPQISISPEENVIASESSDLLLPQTPDATDSSTTSP